MINYWAKPFQMRPRLNEQIYFQNKLDVNLAGFQSPDSKVCLDLRMEWVTGGCITSPRHPAKHSKKKQTVILQNNFFKQRITRVNKCYHWLLFIIGRSRLRHGTERIFKMSLSK